MDSPYPKKDGLWALFRKKWIKTVPREVLTHAQVNLNKIWDFRQVCRLGMPWTMPTLNSLRAGGSSVSQGYFISEHAPNEELKKKNEEPNWAWIGLDFEDQADVHI